jgi:hypothetical protein
MRLDLAELAYLCLRLGHDRLNIEVIKTSLDALAGIRPCQPGHMRPGIPHLFAGGNGAVMQILVRWARPRPSAAHPLEGPQLRADGGSEMSGCRLAILRRRLMQMNLQRWSEREMVQSLDWSRLQARAVAWDDPHTPEMGKAPMQQAG